MLHACVERFDVMGGRGNILGWDWEVNTPVVYYCEADQPQGCNSNLHDAATSNLNSQGL
jgi:hypothetical protein